MQQSKSNSQTSMPAPKGREPNDIERIMISLVIARDQDSPNQLWPIVGDTGYLSAFAVGMAKLRLGNGGAKLEFFTASGVSASGFFAPLEEAIFLRNESELLASLTHLFEKKYKSPLLLTWKGSEFDIPFLKSRMFAARQSAHWLLRASQPDSEDLFTANHMDLCRYLGLERLSISLDQALCEIGFPRDSTVRGLARLELTASGLLVLAANAFCRRGEISEDAFDNFVDTFEEWARQFSATRSHFGVYAAEEAVKSEQQ